MIESEIGRESISMSTTGLFQTRADGQLVSNSEAMLARYKHLRHVSRGLNDKLVGRLSKDVIHEGAGKLAMLQGKTLVFDSEDETSVLMDYCIYDVLREGRNAIEDYLSSYSTDTESDELICLRAMQNAIYSIFMIESVVPGLGVTVKDMRTSAIHLVIDTGFAISGQPGAVFASRLLFHDGFAMTGGAGLPMGLIPPDGREGFEAAALALLEWQKGPHYDPATLIRECRSNGASSNIRYIEPTGQIDGRTRLTMSQAQVQVEPYEPCPCGSGKKFKFCCRKKG